ncbi:unnamed protein product [Didymodactylos carnosus]|uniref:EGF domain-specific O-linked N-acetylglucosamine transferase n=1 Tax=Didymodactylos carnosus TaxID=1234261 RepID=A0A8S2TBJ7_9BILA|nr:unnamed protein product [Didymodactylos carnosus]CAF4279592.1 unnamed protein product [Didymodactylos carnosus]
MSYTHKRIAYDQLQSTFSVLPLLTPRTWFNNEWLLIKHLIHPGTGGHRAFVNELYYWHPMRSDHPRWPYLDRQQQKYFFAYSDHILKKLNLSSKLDVPSTTTTGVEYIVVINRARSSRRITNAEELLKKLKVRFKNGLNTTNTGQAIELPSKLRVYPTVYDFSRDMHASAKLMRQTRLLIGVHGAGLGNMMFMRPGAIMLEVSGIRCDYLSVHFGTLARMNQLIFREWVQTNGFGTGSCRKEGAVQLNIDEVVDLCDDLLQTELAQREAAYQQTIRLIQPKH